MTTPVAPRTLVAPWSSSSSADRLGWRGAIEAGETQQRMWGPMGFPGNADEVDEAFALFSSRWPQHTPAKKREEEGNRNSILGPGSIGYWMERGHELAASLQWGDWEPRSGMARAEWSSLGGCGDPRELDDALASVFAARQVAPQGRQGRDVAKENSVCARKKK